MVAPMETGVVDKCIRSVQYELHQRVIRGAEVKTLECEIFQTQEGKWSLFSLFVNALVMEEVTCWKSAEQLRIPSEKGSYCLAVLWTNWILLPGNISTRDPQMSLISSGIWRPSKFTRPWFISMDEAAWISRHESGRLAQVTHPKIRRAVSCFAGIWCSNIRFTILA